MLKAIIYNQIITTITAQQFLKTIRERKKVFEISKFDSG